MLIQEEEGEDQTQKGTDDANAEFSGVWDELQAAEEGQPAEGPGRQPEDGSDEDQRGDEAGQGSDEDTSPDASAAEQASGEQDSDDLWANADPRQKAAFEAAEAARVQAEQQARSHGGRAGQLAKELKELKAALAEQRNAGNATEKGEESSDEEERFQQLREEYPELAAPIIDRMVKMETQLRELSGDKAAKAEADSNADLDALLAEQPKLLTDAHPDWSQTVLSPEFVAWRDDPNTPPVVKRIILEDNAQQIVNAADCAFVLDLFKLVKGEADPTKELDRQRERQLQAGSMPTTRTPTVKRERAESYEAVWDELEAQERRRSNGRR